LRKQTPVVKLLEDGATRRGIVLRDPCGASARRQSVRPAPTGASSSRTST
jgi:hypothetical protein